MSSGKLQQIRKDGIKKRKNFLPTLLVTIILWLALLGLVYFIDPTSLGAVPLAFVILFLSLLFTFSILFINRRRGLVASITITFFLVLRYFGIGNLINFLLILGVAISIELFFSKR